MFTQRCINVDATSWRLYNVALMSMQHHVASTFITWPSSYSVKKTHVIKSYNHTCNNTCKASHWLAYERALGPHILLFLLISTSKFRLTISKFRHNKSKFWLNNSKFWLNILKFRLIISNFWHKISKFRLIMSKYQHNKSKFLLSNSKFRLNILKCRLNNSKFRLNIWNFDLLSYNFDIRSLE